LAERISKAHREKKPFKVIIMIPLLPGFEGDVREDNSVVMRVQLYWEYWTISRSSHSLYRKLKHIANIDDYVKFYSLRQHGSTKDDLPLTEILYIHSKLMIVDDKRLIIGSANINDRSLVGDRDSELAIVIENQNGKPGSFSAEIQKFRVDLFVEHF
jgi:phospholipase D1/2